MSPGDLSYYQKPHHMGRPILLFRFSFLRTLSGMPRPLSATQKQNPFSVLCALSRIRHPSGLCRTLFPKKFFSTVKFPVAHSPLLC